jgi:Tfp pilus assembly protein PilN
VDTGSAMPAIFLFSGVVLGLAFLTFLYLTWQKQVNEESRRIATLSAEKTQLEQIKQQVDSFQKQKGVLQQRVSTIEQLQRDRTGGQELLDMVANTVSRTENLWLTNVTRKGNSLTLQGSSASINAVANFITALKRSGYFQKVEIKESKQDERNTGIQTYNFEISAEITPPQAVTKPATGPAQAAPPARKG